ncbi:MAG: aminotransferase class I/II-fold pyridoxal phosphate-dependent enzyme [Lachnospiraceae bacterium]|nr:aminotransferase class I/II-fold pyridoxal phosphate-dependent enzyme [Lachnospiraceae bacterium]
MTHGGDIYRNIVEYDFSVNINPLGTPESVNENLKDNVTDVACYPDYESEELRKLLSDYYCLNIDSILCGNGASELFMAVVHALNPKKAIVPVPSFYGYKYVLTSAGTEIIYYQMKEYNGFRLDEGIIDFLDREKDIDMLFLANPNNPVGNLVDSGLMDKLLDKCKEKNIFVILDECFMNLSSNPDSTKSGELDKWDNLCIIRAFTKTFAMPALRLGYLIGNNKDFLKKIKAHLPEWNVSLLAQRAGVAALNSGNYICRARTVIDNERIYLTNCINDMGFMVYPSDANFIMIKTDKPIYDILLKRGILIRDCSDFEGLKKGFYRIAVKTHRENELLVNCLKDI